ncbi:hypothetical protein [Alistipes sp.]|uniref:hypothetical protein n=1 Tax=Alistipes sp. TaxID=1872444 RepID=UPI003AF1BAA7
MSKLANLHHGEIIEPVEFETKALMMDSGNYELYAEVSGKYLDRGKRRRYAPNMSFRYCPFCGQPLRDK